MKTESQLSRTEKEWDSVDGAVYSAHYYCNIKYTKWKDYLSFLESHLLDEFRYRGIK
jgi:hypothetical protein